MTGRLLYRFLLSKAVCIKRNSEIGRQRIHTMLLGRPPITRKVVVKDNQHAG